MRTLLAQDILNESQQSNETINEIRSAGVAAQNVRE